MDSLDTDGFEDTGTSDPSTSDPSTSRDATSRSRSPVDLGALTRATLDLLAVRRVFGEAYERGGVLVIPVAQVLGGTGSGWGSGEGGDAVDGEDPGYGSGEGGGGGGLGVRVRPVGVYVLDDQGVHWRPALDLNRIVLGGQVLAAVAVVGLSRALRRRRRR